MSTPSEAFVPVLLRRQLLTPAQLDDARQTVRHTGARLDDALVAFRYVTRREVAQAWAEALGLTYLDLADIVVPPEVIELMPESVARENVVLPLVCEARVLVVALADPSDTNLLEKLAFILNRPIKPVLAVRDQVVAAIDRHYGQTETESVDSMLAEFTDTAIDFTGVEASECDLELADAEPPPQPDGVKARRSSGSPIQDRQATVRYYERMNPERMFPLLVVLSAKEVREVVQRGVAQAKSQSFQVAEGSIVEIEPVLPGCACYPPKEQVRVTGGPVTTTFWVVPHVLGKVMQARVVVRQDGRSLAEVSLDIRVVRQSMALLVGTLSLVLPFVLLLLKHFELDFESQLKNGFGLYAQLAGWLVRSLTPEVLTGLLLAATLALYLCCRPRRRDVFWDIDTTGQEVGPAIEPARERGLATKLDADPYHQPTLLALADQHYEASKHGRALPLYQRAMALGPMEARHYFRASLCAGQLRDNLQALAILREAEQRLPSQQMKGPLWYNMGCFASRLGRYAEAMEYLRRAVAAGWRDPARYRCDEDLEPLRWKPEFKQLLAAMAS